MRLECNIKILVIITIKMKNLPKRYFPHCRLRQNNLSTKKNKKLQRKAASRTYFKRTSNWTSEENIYYLDIAFLSYQLIKLGKRKNLYIITVLKQKKSWRSVWRKMDQYSVDMYWLCLEKKIKQSDYYMTSVFCFLVLTRHRRVQRRLREHTETTESRGGNSCVYIGTVCGIPQGFLVCRL